jgi:hypothetical protein
MLLQRALPSGLAALAVGAACCLCASMAAPAAAVAGPASLGELLSNAGPDDRHNAVPMVARFVSDEGDSFVFDRSTSTPMLRFQESTEILVLTPSPAARGDTIYRDEFGEPVLRQTKLGGVTLFSHERPGGAPVAVEGQAPALRLQTMGPGALVQHLALASLRATHAARRLIVFDADEVTPGAEPVFADAANVAAEAVMKITERRDGRSILARFNRFLFLPGASAAARLEKGVMNITVAPGLGVLGRPSSARIIQAALHR